jgi:hypothetical protein
LYLRKLVSEKKYQQCVAAGDRIIQRRGLSFAAMGVTAADTHTYFSKDFLGNLILLETMQARSLGRTPVVNEGAELRQLVKFLDGYSEMGATYGGSEKDDPSISMFDIAGGDPLDPLMSRVQSIVAEHPGDTVDLSDALGESAAISRDGEEVTLYVRGKLLYAIKRSQDGDFEWLSSEEAAQGLRAFSKKEIESRSTKDMHLFNVMSYEDTVEVDFGNQTYTVSAEELAGMRSGRPLSADHPLSQAFAATTDGALVLYSNPLTASKGKLRDGADDFAFLLQRVMPDRQVYRDPLSAQTAERVRRLNGLQLASASDLVAVVADSSFSVTDFKIVQNLKVLLRKAGMDVRTFTPGAKIWNGEHGKAVIVITGHIDQRLASFVNDLGRQGVFDGNYVVFNSCRSPLTRELITAINTKFNAEATFAYDAKIDASNVSNLVRELAQTIQANPSANFPESVRDAVRKANLNGIWTICYLSPRFEIENLQRPYEPNPANRRTRV